MSGYVPKSQRKIRIYTKEADSKCKDDDHFWRPITELGTPTSAWSWICANCEATRPTAPSMARSSITLAELDTMIDTSLKVADHVEMDDQSVFGELWIMRSALWHYHPFKIHCIYHVLDSIPFVLLFRYNRSDNNWLALNDTQSYRELLVRADMWRQQTNPKITV